MGCMEAVRLANRFKSIEKSLLGGSINLNPNPTKTTSMSKWDSNNKKLKEAKPRSLLKAKSKSDTMTQTICMGWKKRKKLESIHSFYIASKLSSMILADTFEDKSKMISWLILIWLFLLLISNIDQCLLKKKTLRIWVMDVRLESISWRSLTTNKERTLFFRSLTISNNKHKTLNFRAINLYCINYSLLKTLSMITLRRKKELIQGLLH